MNRTACGIVGALALCVLAGTAAGVDPSAWARGKVSATSAQPGDARIERGTLRRGDTTLTTGEYYDEYEFRAERGQRIRVTAESEDFDAYLIIIDPDEEQTEGDDISRSNTNASVEMEAPRTGRYTAVVTSASRGERGDYVLRIEVLDAGEEEPRPDSRRVPAPADRGGGDVSVILDERGTLRRGDEELQGGEYFDRYTFEGREGQRVTVRLESDDFDPYLILKDPDGEQEENDDLGESRTVSQIESTLGLTGEYEVLVTSYSAGERGAYHLVVTLDGEADPEVRPTPRVDRPEPRPERPDARPDRPEPRPERPAGDRQARPVDGEESLTTEQGSLEDGDETLDSGEFVDEYRFTAEAGQHVVVRMNSEDFDTYLIVQPPEGEQIDNDDFSGSTSVSFVETTATTGGEWVVRATSFEEGEEGDYELTISVSNSDRFFDDSETVAIGDGDEAEGSLDEDDLQRFTGEYADVYTFEGEPGRFYTVEVNGARNLDTFLLLDREGGANLSNDDFEGRLSRSRLSFLVTQPGPVNLIVSTFEAGDTGDYTISVSGQDEVPEWHHEPSVTAGRVFGVFAGITDYSSRDQSDLQYCAQDAERAYHNAIEGLGMSEGDGVLLMDEDATAEAIEDAVRRFGAQMDYDDKLIVFYSGHGGQIDRSGYQPLDPDMQDETLVLADRDMTDDEMDDLLTSVRRGTVMVVLDSCHSGGFAKDVISRPGRMGLFASAEDCLSLVATEREAGGYLADFFVEAIGDGRPEADTDGDRKLTVLELCQFIAERYRTEVVSDSKPPAAPREWTDTISPSEYLGYQQLLIDRGGIGPHEVLFGW